MKKIYYYIGAAVLILAAAQFILGIPVTQTLTTTPSTIESIYEGEESLHADEKPESRHELQQSESDGESEARSSHGESATRNNHHWGNTNTLQDHFDRHGADFNAEDPEDYARQANEFYQKRDEYQVKTDEHGVARVYDDGTNTFGAYNKNGTTRSFFKPSGGQDYFDRQPGE